MELERPGRRRGHSQLRERPARACALPAADRKSSRVDISLMPTGALVTTQARRRRSRRCSSRQCCSGCRTGMGIRRCAGSRITLGERNDSLEQGGVRTVASTRRRSRIDGVGVSALLRARGRSATRTGEAGADGAESREQGNKRTEGTRGRSDEFSWLDSVVHKTRALTVPR